MHNDCSEAMTAYIRNAVSKADNLARQFGGKNIVGSTFSEFKPTQVNVIKLLEKSDGLLRKDIIDL